MAITQLILQCLALTLRTVDRPQTHQVLQRAENARLGNESDVHKSGVFVGYYMSMVLRIRPTASPSISNGSPGSTTMVW